MKRKIAAFKSHVIICSRRKRFVHCAWFLDYHLTIVDQIAHELLSYYPEAKREYVEVLVWLHDYGKILNFADQYRSTLSAGRKILTTLGFPARFVDTVIDYAELLDKKTNLKRAPIEVQIVSSADGASHLVGPFFYLWWYEHPERDFRLLMADNLKKALKDWNRKIVLKEVRQAFVARHRYLLEQATTRRPRRYLEKAPCAMRTKAHRQ